VAAVTCSTRGGSVQRSHAHAGPTAACRHSQHASDGGTGKHTWCQRAWG
jgi:hypothetical protein